MIASKYMKKITVVFKPQYYHIASIYDGGDRYLFTIRRNGVDEDLVNSYYTIHKRNLNIDGFLPHMEYDFYRKAIKHPIELDR